MQLHATVTETATTKGTGKMLLEAISHVGPGYSVFTGVDLGVRTSKGSDPTAMVTVVRLMQIGWRCIS